MSHNHPFFFHETFDALCEGSVKVVGCLKQDEVVSWEALPQGVSVKEAFYEL
jgi:hypothetical protein